MREQKICANIRWCLYTILRYKPANSSTARSKIYLDIEHAFSQILCEPSDHQQILQFTCPILTTGLAHILLADVVLGETPPTILVCTKLFNEK